MLKTKYLVFSSFILFFAQQSFGQGQGNNPYSILGFGEESGQTNASQEMMGGTGASFGNGFYLNTVNPALMLKNRAAGAFKYFSFNIGLKGNYRTLSQKSLTQVDYGMNLNDLSLSFPLNNNWAMGFTMNPYSIVDYKSISNKSITGSTTESIIYDNTYSGGITRVGYVNSLRFFKNLYVGFSAYYNFGTIKKDSSTYFADNLADQLRNSTRITANGANARLGVAWQQKLNEKWQINLGGVYEKSANLKTETLRTFGNYFDTGTGAILVNKPDTVSLLNGTASTPDHYKVGISLEDPFHWILAADYGITKWSEHKSTDPLSQKYYADSKELALGLEWLPNASSTKFYNQVFYRVGFNTTKTPYVIGGQQIRDNKVSLGISMPMGFRNPSYINIGTAFGQRGLSESNQIRENYVRLSVSVSLLSPWFIKPKID